MVASQRKGASSRSRPRRLATWREQHACSLATSMQRLAAHPLGTLLTVLVMGFALSLPLAFWLVLGNLEQMAGTLGRSQAVNVFMQVEDRKSTRLNSSHVAISYAVFCLKKKMNK